MEHGAWSREHRWARAFDDVDVKRNGFIDRSARKGRSEVGE